MVTASPLSGWIPPSGRTRGGVHVYTRPLVAGLGSAGAAAWSTQGIVARLHEGPLAGSNQAKGILGEALMQRLVRNHVLAGTGWSAATPIGAPNGIDGLFFKIDAGGLPRDMMIMEAKTYGARLGGARFGRQMSSGWISHYLDRSSQTYGELADRLAAGSYEVVNRIPDGVRTIHVPLGGGESATVWQDGRQVRVCLPEGSTPDDARRQLRNLSAWMEKGASGDVDFRARIFRYDTVDGRHRITVRSIDPQTLNLGEAQVITERFEDLPPDFQVALRESFAEAFQVLGKSADETAELVERACHDPDFAERMQAEARFRLDVLRWSRILGAALLTGAVVAAIDVLGQWWARGELNLRRSAWVGSLAAASVLLSGSLGGISTGVLLSTQSGTHLLAALPGSSHKLWARALGSSGGAILAVVALIGTQLALGVIDRETAGRQLAVAGGGIVAGAATTGGMFAFAGLFTTATTGVQIGTLTGAAFHSAVFAFWGGGAKAAGGFGMAVGGPVIGAAAFVASVAASLTFGKVWREVDDGRRRRLIFGRWQIVMGRVQEGQQVEWDEATG